jgi:allantoinase
MIVTQMDRMALISRRVVTPDGVRPASVHVNEGKIVGVDSAATRPDGYEIIDVGDDCILPGLVDTHVHINEPGRTDWEGFETATQAAAAGGYTTLVDMPLNCLPETTTVDALNLKREAASGKCWVDWASWGGVVADNQPHLLPLAAAGVPGYKCFLIYPGCEGFTMASEAQLREAMPFLAQTGLPLLVHAELAAPIDEAVVRLAGADWRAYKTYLASRPDEAELLAIKLLIGLSREFGVWIHIVHLATSLGLPLLAKARAQGLPITVETCPHYLLFEAEQIPDGATEFKCAPPIRSHTNREGLWDGLANGIIDLVATDHSPCPIPMKGLEAGDFQKAWGGIASLSVSLPAMWTEASARGFELTDLARWMASEPARLAGFRGRKGVIQEGADADLVIFDPDETWQVTVADLYFRHKISPYVGKEVRGRVKRTLLRGSTVFDRDGFEEAPFGKELVGGSRR